MADIYTLLRRDHNELKPMLAELAQGRREPFERLAAKLKVHSEAEEKTFYKSLEDRAETKALVAEGYREHQEADRLSQELMTAKGGSGPDFTAIAQELRESMEHHIREEEQELFPRARAILSEEEAGCLGERFEESKHAIMRGAAFA
jgi:hemerythrin-like domain-containing protein